MTCVYIAYNYFNITTDYLLKDEIETIDGADNYSSKNVDMQMLNKELSENDFQNIRYEAEKKKHTSYWLLIIAPFIMILISVKSLEDALLLAKGRDVYISGGYGLFKEALQIVDKMYITEVDLNIEDGDTFFPEFDINDFEVLIGETLGEEVKYTRTFYVRKNELSRFWI